MLYSGMRRVINVCMRRVINVYFYNPRIEFFGVLPLAVKKTLLDVRLHVGYTAILPGRLL